MTAFYHRGLCGAITTAIAVLACINQVGCTDSAGERNIIVATPPTPLAPVRQEGDRDVYRLTYAGGEPALVAIAGRGLDALELRVLDGAGHPVCLAQRVHDQLSCRWRPAATEEVTVEVRNTGRGPLRYRLWTN
jgi:hypothetical protein